MTHAAMFVFFPASAGTGILGANFQNDLRRMDAGGGATRRYVTKNGITGARRQLALRDLPGYERADGYMWQFPGDLGVQVALYYDF